VALFNVKVDKVRAVNPEFILLLDEVNIILSVGQAIKLKELLNDNSFLANKIKKGAGNV